MVYAEKASGFFSSPVYRGGYRRVDWSFGAEVADMIGDIAGTGAIVEEGVVIY